jgi:hypothetical protein
MRGGDFNIAQSPCERGGGGGPIVVLGPVNPEFGRKTWL